MEGLPQKVEAVDEVSSADDNGLPPSILKKKPEFFKKLKSKFKGGT